MLRRGAASGFFHEARERQKRASLVETGRHAGRSRVNFGGFRGVTLNYHAWKRGACPPFTCSKAFWVMGLCCASLRSYFVLWTSETSLSWCLLARRSVQVEAC